MSASQLIAQYSGAARIDNPPWLVLEQQGLEDQAATVRQAASLVDEMFDRDPCVDDSEDIQGGEEADTDEDGQVRPPVDWDAFRDIILGRDDIICDDEGCDRYTIRVYRSHLDAPYKLLLDNGEIESTRRIEHGHKQMLSFRGSTSAGLDYPVQSGLTVSWYMLRNSLGSSLRAVTLTPSGPELVAPQTITGQAGISYQTACDEVKIAVPRTPADEPGECLITALYEGAAYELEIKPKKMDPSVDSVARTLACGKSDYEPEDKDYSCYERVYHRILCRCSGEESGGSYYTEEDVSCPEMWGDDISPGRHNVGSRSVIERYVSCPDEQNLYTTQDHRDICCEPGTPPLCDTIYSLYSGGKGFDVEAARAEYGNDVVLVPVGPKDGACGSWTIKYKKPRLNCCDKVSPLEPDPNNPTEITPGGSRRMRILIGDVASTTVSIWTVSGNLVFENGLNEIHGGVEHWVYAPAETCDNYTVRVDDGCSHVSMTLAGGGEPLSLSRYLPFTEQVGFTYVEVQGGVPPYILTTTGAHTSFANQEKEIVLTGEGVVEIRVFPQQICDGDFDVIVSDACAAIQSQTIPVGEIPTGMVCVKHKIAGPNYFYEDPWIEPLERPVWISYTDIHPPSPAYIYKFENPSMGPGSWVVGLEETASATYIKIESSIYNDTPAWKVTQRTVINAVIVAPFCEECK